MRYVSEKEYIKVGKDPAAGIILTWWSGLEEDRGSRAELRRCHTMTEVMFCPSFHRLYQSLAAEGRVSREGVALIAGVLSHVKSPQAHEKLGKLMADKRSSSIPKVSESRFRRLLRITDRDELFQQIIRIVALLGGSVHVNEVSEIVYYWNDSTRRNLAFAYYEDAIKLLNKDSGAN